MLRGVGVNYLEELKHEWLDGSTDEVAFVEAAPEEFGRRALGDLDALKRIRAALPVTLHSTVFSLASAPDFDRTYVPEARAVSEALGITEISDHLTFSRVGSDIDVELYMPPPLIPEALAQTAANCRAFMEATGLRVSLENIGAIVAPVADAWGEGRFFQELAKAAGVGLVMNTDSILVSAATLGVDPWDIARTYPLDAMRSITVVPYDCMNPLLRKHYGKGVDDASVALVEKLLAATSCRTILIQRRYAVNTLASMKPMLDRLNRLLAA